MSPWFKLLLAAGVWLAGWQAEENGREEGGTPATTIQPEEQQKSAVRKWPGPRTAQPDARLTRAMQSVTEEAVEAYKETHGVVLMSAGQSADRIEIKVRRFGDFERPFTEEELQAVRSALYEAAGEPFPLEIIVFGCCGKPSLTGKITEIDEQAKRVLIVDEHQTLTTGNPMPMAIWARLEEDGRVVGEKSGRTMEWAELRVGQRVSLWHNGMVAASYPGRTSALKLEVTEE
ncbi:DUF3221 domain-containing protein [Paenibacillus puerhi]|uniref:DUF3221 domain-containing protein n=1 Tax=Paenibacillus puerhi TaxID=2692622 RepID=UPI001356E053|nr:DUF3221 domain-containing protein [Paenibacillus puerhi]